MIVFCSECGKRCYVSPSDNIDEDHFHCFNCHVHLHKTVKKQNRTAYNKILAYANHRKQLLQTRMEH